MVSQQIPSYERAKKLFPQLDITLHQWTNWKWQLKNRITTQQQLQGIIQLSHNELLAFQTTTNLPFAITPYYATLITNNENDPIRKCVIPTIQEQCHIENESFDSLHEEEQSPVPGIIHRYPDRVLFLATDYCSTYCRYCTRSRIVGKSKYVIPNKQSWIKAIQYIRNNTQIRDVLISGGDPLTLPNSVLDFLLTQLRAIRHVEIIRIGTKIPIVLPFRINDILVTILKKYHPLWINIHITHPNEITSEVKYALSLLADAGIPLGSQTVLLKDINNNAITLKQLYHLLLQCRVRPYYLYQCDLVPGTSHFRTSVQEGINIIKQLQGHTTGFAVPQYVIDAPGGGGKIPITPDYYKITNDIIILHNYLDKYYIYQN